MASLNSPTPREAGFLSWVLHQYWVGKLRFSRTDASSTPREGGTFGLHHSGTAQWDICHCPVLPSAAWATAEVNVGSVELFIYVSFLLSVLLLTSNRPRSGDRATFSYTLYSCTIENLLSSHPVFLLLGVKAALISSYFCCPEHPVHSLLISLFVLPGSISCPDKI